MTAGETKKITLEFDWTVPNISKDWSLVTYGSKGGVTLTHNGGLTSDSFPNTVRQEASGGSPAPTPAPAPAPTPAPTPAPEPTPEPSPAP